MVTEQALPQIGVERFEDAATVDLPAHFLAEPDAAALAAEIGALRERQLDMQERS